ncbi:MAG: NupC/NupG family nucleoside CNT transporter [Cyclobacteriaceae bacterium]|nr:NupC/NupG family nucleoside CNT transporter [Cyclobacteriaceae bacterium HetDA_MAG_MS6]
MEYLRGILGLVLLVGIAYLISGKKKIVDWRLVGVGIVIQIVVGLLIAKVGFVQSGFEWISASFVKFLSFALNGAEFLYGDLAKNSDAVDSARHNLGFLFVFQALPTVIFFSSVTAGLYYLGVLQKIVFGFAWIMAKTMRLSGAESLSAAGNIFLGQTEAPLLVRPFIGKMTASELNCLMTGGMATIAGSVLGAYVAFLGGGDASQQARFATYLLSASIMNAPAAIVMAKIFLPETEPDKIDGSLKVNKESLGVNLIDSLAKGASDGVKLALNIGGMLLAFIAIIYSLNWILVDGIGEVTGLNAYVVSSTRGAFDGFSLQYILGQVFRLLAFIMGVDWAETIKVGSLLGQKTVINEFVAYLSLAEMKSNGLLNEKSIVISTYALCGFANFSSIAIQIGGIGGMAPDRQADLSKLGFKALMAATLATMMTATIAGVLML